MYLEYLDNPDFVVYTSAKGEYLNGFTAELSERVPSNMTLPKEQCNSAAGNNNINNSDSQPTGVTADGEDSANGEDSAEIIIDGHDYAVNEKGLNIVVWSNSMGKVVDSVSFDVIAGSSAVRRD